MKSSGSLCRVLIVDDYPLLRRGLRELLDSEADFRVGWEAAGEAEAQTLAAEHDPDLALVDVNLQDGSGLALVKQLRRDHEALRVLVISMHDEVLYAERALAAGAHGYIMKQAPEEEMLRAVRRVADGRFYVTDAIRERLFPLEAGELSDAESSSPVERLSDRELEVFLLISQGYAPRHIAEALHLSVKTVDSHREHLKRKLDLERAAELTRYAIAWSKHEQHG